MSNTLPKRPKTMHVKTNLLMRGDWVVHDGTLWRVKDIKVIGSNYNKSVDVTISSEDKDVIINDSRCKLLGSGDLSATNPCMWWRVVTNE